MYTSLHVILRNATETLQLDYQIRDTRAAQLWAKCVAEAGSLRETDRFSNFPGQEDTDDLLHRLATVTDTLREFHPDLDFPPIDRENLQASINDLHYNFAHSHHITLRINAQNEKSWSDFNVLLHAIEASASNARSTAITGLASSRIVFTWNAAAQQPIPDECYGDFVVGRDFGTVYANYCQVGRHFLEMFWGQDDQLDDAHIQPSRYINGDTDLWFGPTTGHRSARSTVESLHVWFEQRAERFNRLGYYWGDPKLALGQLPVARLQTMLVSPDEIDRFVRRLAQFSQVARVFVS